MVSHRLQCKCREVGHDCFEVFEQKLKTHVLQNQEFIVMRVSTYLGMKRWCLAHPLQCKRREGGL